MKCCISHANSHTHAGARQTAANRTEMDMKKKFFVWCWSGFAVCAKIVFLCLPSNYTRWRQSFSNLTDTCTCSPWLAHRPMRFVYYDEWFRVKGGQCRPTIHSRPKVPVVVRPTTCCHPTRLSSRWMLLSCSIHPFRSNSNRSIRDGGRWRKCVGGQSGRLV